MPDTAKNTENTKEQFYIRLKAGLFGIESGGKYTIENPTSKAMGKYQFLPEWLHKKDVGIIDYAKKHKIFGEVKGSQDFLNNPELQEAYFKYYAKTFLYPQAEKAVSGPNPLNLSVDQAGAIFHYDSPQRAKQQISTGVLKAATKKGVNGARHDNVSGARYQNAYMKGLADAGLKPMGAVVDEKTKKQVIDNFESQNKEIDELDVDDTVKEKLRSKLYQEVVNNGNRDIVNEYLDNDNKKKDEELAKIENLKKVLDGAEMKYRRPNSKKDKTYKLSSIYVEGKKKEDVQKAIKDFPEVMKNGTLLKDGSFIVSTPIAVESFLSTLNNKEKELGYEISKRDANGGSMLNGLNNFIPDFLQDATGGALMTETFSSSTKRTSEVKKRSLITPEYFPDPEQNFEEDEAKVDENKKSGEEAPSKTKEKAEEDKLKISASEEWFNNELHLGSVKSDDFNYGKTKRDLPIDAIMGMTLGIIGSAQAKEAKIPLRTEEVSDAIRNMTADLAKKVKEGLPVEVEANMRQSLAEALQGGLQTIVNTSAGNRATVLGNLGQLENAKSKGLVAIQVADYEAKDRAFQQYGESLKYINDFDTNRDIANHAIKYGEELRKREKGEQLAEAGWAKMIEGIKYDKENGPGSTNDMYRSLLMQKMYGFDPKQKDDGSGLVPGTKSAYDKKKFAAIEEHTKTKGLYERAQRMNPNQRKGLDIFIAHNTDKNNIAAITEYIEKNPEIDYSKISMDNIDLALKENDFGLLGKKRVRIGMTGDQLNQEDVKEAQGMADPNAVPTITLPQEEVENPEDRALEKMGLLNAYPEGPLNSKDAQDFADILTYGAKQ